MIRTKPAIIITTVAAKGGMILKRCLALFACMALPGVILVARQDGSGVRSPEACTLSGFVVDGTTSDPLRDASVYLSDSSGAESVEPFGPADDQVRSEYSTVSLRDGGFCFTSTKPGTYILTARKTLFLEGAFGSGEYPQLGSPLVIADKAISGLIVKLYRLSGISGRITDADGEPVPDVNVIAMKQTWVHGRKIIMPVQGTQSDERGEYRIGKLTPATYFVYAQPVPTVVAQRFSLNGSAAKPPPAPENQPEIVRTYYPSAPSLDDAAPLTVPVADDLRDVAIAVRKGHTFHVKGRVRGAQDELRDGAVRLLPIHEEPMMITAIEGGNMAPEATFDIADVAPGVYTLTFHSPTATGTAQVKVDDADAYVDISAIQNGALHCQIVTEGTPEPNMSVKVTLISIDSAIQLSYSAAVNKNGECRVNNVPAGNYFLQVVPGPAFYVKSIVAGSVDASTGNVIVAGNGPTAVSVVLRKGVASVSGVIASGPETIDHALSPLHVLFIPASCGSVTFCGGVIFGVTDTSGHFEIKSIAPGEYRALALLSVNREWLQNPSALAMLFKQGVTVDIPENRDTNVQLPALANNRVFVEN
jgi:hypothetical protein